MSSIFLPSSLKYVLERVKKIAWALFLVSLPVTSFPFFPREVGGGTLVRPLAVYPLVVLILLITLPRMLTKRLPKTLLSFLPFVCVSLASVLIASLQGVESSQGVSVSARMLRGLTTLGLGSAMYFTIVLFPQGVDDLRNSIRWVYVGFALALLWSTFQAVYVLYFSATWFEVLSKVQQYVSIRRLFINRVSGLTYEPNWFADQISFVLLPWLLASVISGYSVFDRHWRRLTIEWLLLIWSLLVLPFTFSRAGIFIMLVLVFLSVVSIRVRGDKSPKVPRFLTHSLVKRLLLSLILLLILAGLIFAAGTKNAFFARLWDYWQRKPDQGYIQYILGYFEYLGFGARFSYWETAYRVYQAYPVLGVGLGNYAFYFDEMLPDRPLASMPEVLRSVVPEEGRNRLVTSKNFYFRLLAETGLLGAAAFLAFLVAILGCVVYMWLSDQSEARYWAVAGLLGMVAFILVAFSFDSFAIPNMWVVFGFITASAHISHQSPHPGQTT